jgi:hypothetical protein
MASPRTLSLAAIPSRPVKGRRSASSYPFGPGSSPGYPRTAPEFLEKDASLRLLQPTSLHEHPADCSIPGCVSLRVTPRGVLTPRCARARTRRLALGHGPGGDEVGSPTPLARRANQVELRLTANLQLQPLPQLVTWILLAGLSASFLDQVHQTQRSPGGAAIDSPSAPNLPIRAFSAANRACDEASDVLFCDPGWIRIDRRPRRVHPRDLGQSRDDGGDPQTPGPAGSPSPGAARSASAAASSKDDDVIESGRLPSKRAPSPALCARAHNARITRSLPVTMAFATAIRLQRCFTRGASPEGEPAG